MAVSLSNYTVVTPYGFWNEGLYVPTGRKLDMSQSASKYLVLAGILNKSPAEDDDGEDVEKHSDVEIYLALGLL